MYDIKKLHFKSFIYNIKIYFLNILLNIIFLFYFNSYLFYDFNIYLYKLLDVLNIFTFKKNIFTLN